MSALHTTPAAFTASEVARRADSGWDVLVALPIHDDVASAMLAVLDADGTTYAVQSWADGRPAELHPAETGADAGRLAIELAGWSGTAA